MRVAVLLLFTLFVGANNSASAQETGAARETIAAADIAALRDIDGLHLSSDGVWAAFLERRPSTADNTVEQRWMLASIRSREVRVLAGGGDRFQSPNTGRYNGAAVSPPGVWSGDGERFYFLKQEAGRRQIWMARRRGGRAVQITEGEEDVTLLRLTPDRTRLLYRTEPSRTQLRDEASEERIAGFRYDQRFFPNYSPLPVLPRDGDTPPSHDWSYDLTTSAVRPAMQQEAEVLNGPGRAPPAAHARNAGETTAQSHGGSLAWAEALHPSLRGYSPPLTIIVQLIGEPTPIVCPSTACVSQMIRGMWWQDDQELVFAMGEGTGFRDTTYYHWRPASNQPTVLFRTSGRAIGDCDVAQGALICIHDDIDHPAQLVAIDLSNGTSALLYDPNPSFEFFDRGAVPRLIEVNTLDGAAAFGYLVLPPHTSNAAQRVPLVVVTYRCGGFLRGGVGDEYPIYALAAQGFAVLCFDAPEPDYALRARMDWASYSNWARGPGNPMKRRIQDALNRMVAGLIEEGLVDPERISVTGLSLGADIVAYALFTMPHLTAAIASGAEIGPSSSYLYGPTARETLRSWGLESPTSARWQDLSLSRNATRVRAPFLLNVADREMTGALESVAALNDAKRAVEMFVFEDEYHMKWQPAHRLAIYNRNIDWMNFWLRGVESGLTGDATQYERWRAMRDNQCRLFGPNGTERHVRPRGHEELTDEELTPWYCRPGALARSSQ